MRNTLAVIFECGVIARNFIGSRPLYMPRLVRLRNAHSFPLLERGILGSCGCRLQSEHGGSSAAGVYYMRPRNLVVEPVAEYPSRL